VFSSHSYLEIACPREAYQSDADPFDWEGEDCHNIEKEAQRLYETNVGGGQEGHGFAEVDYICKIFRCGLVSLRRAKSLSSSNLFLDLRYCR
jgi:hypothetical protein